MTTVIYTDVVTEETELREIFGWPTARSQNKQIDRLDPHCRSIIGKCPFILLGTSVASGRCDVSPKTGPSIHPFDMLAQRVSRRET